MMFIRLSVYPSARLSGTGVHCDHTVHFSVDLSLRLEVQCSGHPEVKASPPTLSLFSSSTWNRDVVWTCKLDEALNANNDK